MDKFICFKIKYHLNLMSSVLSKGVDDIMDVKCLGINRHDVPVPTN